MSISSRPLHPMIQSIAFQIGSQRAKIDTQNNSPLPHDHFLRQPKRLDIDKDSPVKTTWQSFFMVRDDVDEKDIEDMQDLVNSLTTEDFAAIVELAYLDPPEDEELQSTLLHFAINVDHQFIYKLKERVVNKHDMEAFKSLCRFAELSKFDGHVISFIIDTIDISIPEDSREPFWEVFRKTDISLFCEHALTYLNLLTTNEIENTPDNISLAIKHLAVIGIAASLGNKSATNFFNTLTGSQIDEFISGGYFSSVYGILALCLFNKNGILRIQQLSESTTDKWQKPKAIHVLGFLKDKGFIKI